MEGPIEEELQEDPQFFSKKKGGRIGLHEPSFWQQWRFAIIGLVIVFFLLIAIITIMAFLFQADNGEKSTSKSFGDTFVLVTRAPSPSVGVSPTSKDHTSADLPSEDGGDLSSTTPTTSTPTSHPTVMPTLNPTDKPTFNPTSSPSVPPNKLPGKTVFYAIGDVPYSPQDAVSLRQQILALPSDADFLIHVGDIRAAEVGLPCRIEDYQLVADILQNSSTPVFIVPGDNEWNDCPNINQGWTHFNDTFVGFEGKHWNHNFEIERMPGRPESFAFVHKGSLFIGLNLVGGLLHDGLEWFDRLSTQAQWMISLVRKHRLPTVLFGHANPNAAHSSFFVAIQEFIQNELENSIPILYVNGDKHE